MKFKNILISGLLLTFIVGCASSNRVQHSALRHDSVRTKCKVHQEEHRLSYPGISKCEGCWKKATNEYKKDLENDVKHGRKTRKEADSDWKKAEEDYNKRKPHFNKGKKDGNKSRSSKNRQ